jgi:hypothetical protein
MIEMPEFMIINQVSIQCSCYMSSFITTDSDHYKIHGFRPNTSANIYRSITSNKKYMECTDIHGQDYKSARDVASNHDLAVCRQYACEQSMFTACWGRASTKQISLSLATAS